MRFQRVNSTTTVARLAPFADPLALAYCKALSQALLNCQVARQFSDLMALGYWLRPSNIERLLEPYRALELRPLGSVFHVAPGNVDSLFVYSGILSVLCGNINTVRLSDKGGGSTDILCKLVAELSASHPEVTARFQLVRSHRDACELLQLQKEIDGRILWGSDEGIQALRLISIPAHARELTFANKLSLALVDTISVLHAEVSDLKQLARNFSRDNLTFAQQACSSAKVLVWRGEECLMEEAQQKFWQALSQFLASAEGQEKYTLSEAEHYCALNNAQNLVMNGIAEQLQVCGHYIRIRGNSLHHNLLEAHQGCGLFVELKINQLAELTPQLTSQHQTLAYWGISDQEVNAWLDTCLVGIDRVVPIGQALDFNVIWDGVDLIQALSRKKSL